MKFASHVRLSIILRTEETRVKHMLKSADLSSYTDAFDSSGARLQLNIAANAAVRQRERAITRALRVCVSVFQQQLPRPCSLAEWPAQRSW